MNTPTAASVARAFRLAIARVTDDAAAYEAVTAEVSDPMRSRDLIEALLWAYVNAERERWRLVGEVAVLREYTSDTATVLPVDAEQLVGAWQALLLHCAAHHDDAIQADA